jgi:predicted transcriptional regulator
MKPARRKGTKMNEDAATPETDAAVSESHVLNLTAQIVSAHVGKNQVAPDALPALIMDVFRTLSSVGREPAATDKPQPAVPIKKSIFPDHLVCLEDGKKLKMLKRHLMTSYNMTPDQYRERWGLGADYPMVAPDYARHRSTLAKKIGLGTKPRSRG